jgi:hypothetical protein
VPQNKQTENKTYVSGPSACSIHYRQAWINDQQPRQ